jgi:hypothetical protein
MGNCYTKKRCKICASTNINKKSHICEECTFIPNYITRYGRENLKRILNSSLKIYESPVCVNDNFVEENVKENDNKLIEPISTINNNTHPQPSAPLPNDNYRISRRFSNCKSENCSCQSRKQSINLPPYMNCTA